MDDGEGLPPARPPLSRARREVDLVMKRGRTIAFVEVKTRDTIEAALVSIDAGKQRRFRRAVRSWRSRNPWSNAMTLRADALCLAPGSWPVHVPDAFPLDE
jgi:putative endonuclease